MLRIEHEKWNQSLADLYDRAVKAPHARTRERFMALYEIAGRGTNPTSWAAEIGRHSQSVQSWVHAYNEHGPDVLTFRHTGGWVPLFVRRPAR
jgi:Homeodomain-like domain